MSENPGQGPRGSHSFDELARGLASGSLSRRRALKLFAGAVVGALIPSRALAVPGPCPPNATNKGTICHRPHGNDLNLSRHCASADSAVPAHLPGPPRPPLAPVLILLLTNRTPAPLSPPPNGPPPPMGRRHQRAAATKWAAATNPPPPCRRHQRGPPPPPEPCREERGTVRGGPPGLLRQLGVQRRARK